MLCAMCVLADVCGSDVCLVFVFPCYLHCTALLQVGVLLLSVHVLLLVVVFDVGVFVECDILCLLDGHAQRKRLVSIECLSALLLLLRLFLVGCPSQFNGMARLGGLMSFPAHRLPLDVVKLHVALKV